MTLPQPVLSSGDMVAVQICSYKSASKIWNTWSKDPIKVAVLRAIFPHEKPTFHHFHEFFSSVLSQNMVCFIFIGSGGTA